MVFGFSLTHYGAAGIQPIVRLLLSGCGGSGGGRRSGWWVVGARVWACDGVRVEWKLFAMTWRLLLWGLRGRAIFKRRCYFQALKITRSVENSPIFWLFSTGLVIFKRRGYFQRLCERSRGSSLTKNICFHSISHSFPHTHMMWHSPHPPLAVTTRARAQIHRWRLLFSTKCCIPAAPILI